MRACTRQPLFVTGPSQLLAPYLPQRLVNFGVAPFDQITKSFLTVTGTGALEKVPTYAGLGLRFGATDGSTYLSAPIRGEIIDGGELSMVWVGSVPATGVPIVCRDFSAAGGTIFPWQSAGAFKARAGGINYTESGTWAADAVTTQVLSVRDNGSVYLYANGVQIMNEAASDLVDTLITKWVLHRNGDNEQGINATSVLWATFARQIPANLAQEVSRNPWQLFAPQPQWLYTGMGSGSWTPLEVTG